MSKMLPQLSALQREDDVLCSMLCEDGACRTHVAANMMDGLRKLREWYLEEGAERIAEARLKGDVVEPADPKELQNDGDPIKAAEPSKYALAVQQGATLVAGGPAREYGRLNAYKCSQCGEIIITYDRDDGVTPFTTSCKKTDDCKGTMQSGMYRIAPGVHAEVATHEWYRPTAEELEQACSGFSSTGRYGVIDHVAHGGLLLRAKAKN